MKVNAVILSGSYNDAIETMTQRAIDTLIKYKGIHDLSVTVVESHNDTIAYNHANMVYLIGQEFNYNKSLVAGILNNNECDAYLLCNNDIIAHEGYLEALVDSKYESASPKCPVLELHSGYRGNVPGYRTSYQVCGWCLFVTAQIVDKIGVINLFPPELPFWFQDNFYADQIKRHGFTHALVCDAFVTHIESQSWTWIPQHYTASQRQVYEQLKAKYNL